MSRLVALSVVAVLVSNASTNRAEPPSGPPETDGSADADADAQAGARAATAPPNRLRILWTGLELGAAQAIPAARYWTDIELNRVDWELDWNRESWRLKLFTTEALRFDTNRFYVNAVRHPLAGIVNYQIGRANGFGMLGSSAINLFASSFWEFIVEFPEYISLNDIVINVGAGLSIGEPLLQLGRFGHQISTGAGGRVLASSVSPFDALHGWSGVNGHRGSYWYRMGLDAGLGESVFDGDETRTEMVLAASIDLVGQPGYALAGSQAGWTAPGTWSRIATEIRIGSDDDSNLNELFTGIRLRTQTSMLGHYQQRVIATSEGPRGTGRFVGLGAAFTYDRRQIAGEQDRFAIAHFAGPVVELARYSPRLILRWELASYLDFAMVQAHVFGPDSRLAPELPLTSALAAEGYYFARGLTVTSRARLTTGPWEVGLEARAHQMWSIDGLDRKELDDPDLDPHDIVDQRLFARIEAALRPGDGPLSIAATLELGLRRGAWSDRTRSASELTAITAASWSF